MQKYSTNKDWNVYIRELVKRGWTYRRGSKHGRLSHPDGTRTLTVSCTPGDRRSLKNFKRFTQ